MRNPDILFRVELILYWIAFGIYLLSLLLHLVNQLAHIPFCTERLLSKRRFWLGTGGTILLGVGAALQFVMLLIHSIAANRLPFSDKYECLVVFTMLTVIVHLIARRRWRLIYSAGFFVALLICAVMYAVVASGQCVPQMKPLSAEYDSPWKMCSVGLTYLAYAGLANAFIIELAFCLAWVLYILHLFRPATRRLLGHVCFHRDASRLIMFSFPLLTAGLLCRAVWLWQMSGVYWRWGAVETSSLLTWVVFALYLHATRMKRWRSAVASFFNIFGFLCVLMAMLGVDFMNFVLGG